MVKNINTNNVVSVKRRLATENECQIDLKKELPLMFEAFTLASSYYEREVVNTPIQSRARGYEASLLNSKMIQSIQSTFPQNWKFGKYKRFILRVQGYSVLFKKLNCNNMPMNIKTKYSSAISNQLAMSLFEETSTIIDPILFFGYKKDRTGEIVDPKLVYIDDNMVKWVITEQDIQVIEKTKFLIEENRQMVLPKLKESAKEKKVINL